MTGIHRLSRNLVAILLLAAVLMHVSGIAELQPIHSLERYFYDLRLSLLPKNDKSSAKIVIVDVDEKSLSMLGRWPWPRNRLAQLTDKLFENYHVRVLGYDVVFAEKETVPALNLYENLYSKQISQNENYREILIRLRSHLDHDAQFSKSLDGRSVVLGYFFKAANYTDEMTTGVLPSPATIVATRPLHRDSLIAARAFGANIAELQNTARGAGYIDMSVVDGDGIIRKLSLLQSYKQEVYPSFSLEVARQYLGVDYLNLDVQDYDQQAVIEHIGLGSGYRIPVGDFATAYIPYRGRYPSFTYVSAVDVLNQNIDKSILEDAIVLVGTTASGLFDMRATPFQNVYPGVEIHASMIDGLLKGNIKYQPAYVRGVEFVLLLLLGITLIILLSRNSLASMLSISLLLLGFHLIVSTTLWLFFDVVYPMATSIIVIAGMLMLFVSFGYFTESKVRQRLHRLFGQYVPPEIVNEMATRQGEFSLGGENRYMSVMFCDIRNFTQLSETLKPDEVIRLMNQFLTAMSEVIHQHRGTIDKYIGDAIMAFWGAPLPSKESERNSLDCAFAMIARLEKVNVDFVKQGWPKIRMGIGINAGLMSVGNMGSPFRMAYTVLGDSVNVASRFEMLTKYYGVPIIVGNSIVEEIDDMVFSKLDRVRFVGKKDYVEIYQPVAYLDELDEERKQLLSMHNQALESYFSQDWDHAYTLFSMLEEKEPLNKVYNIFLSRISFYLQHPPGSMWDGVWVNDAHVMAKF